MRFSAFILCFEEAYFAGLSEMEIISEMKKIIIYE